MNKLTLLATTISAAILGAGAQELISTKRLMVMNNGGEARVTIGTDQMGNGMLIVFDNDGNETSRIAGSAVRSSALERAVEKAVDQKTAQPTKSSKKPPSQAQTQQAIKLKVEQPDLFGDEPIVDVRILHRRKIRDLRSPGHVVWDVTYEVTNKTPLKMTFLTLHFVEAEKGNPIAGGVIEQLKPGKEASGAVQIIGLDDESFDWLAVKVDRVETSND